MSRKKAIYTLVPDIKHLISNGKKKVSKASLEKLVKAVKNDAIRFLDPDDKTRMAYLRMSNIGREDRKLWYEIHNKVPVDHPPELLLKFFYGNLVEAMLLFLAAESGHKVTDEQKEVQLEGIKGHIDSKIDGAVIDAKSSSHRGFQKFKNGTLFEDDPFGYVGQLSGYMEAEGCSEGGFLAYDKSTGELALLMVDELTKIDATDRIKYLKRILELDTVPERCYKPIPLGTNGNYILDYHCRYCDFKEKCWSDANNGKGLRKFDYAGGIKYFTHIKVEPRVEELL
tara:strand:+ start:158 stop:1009 length:852 start_codon:yes stop_codon:yes gene_type:complete